MKTRRPGPARTLPLAIGLLAVTLAVACGDEGGLALARPGDPVAVAGTTDQDLQIRLEPIGGRRIRVDVEANCETHGVDNPATSGTREVDLDYEAPAGLDYEAPELVAEVGDDGRFEIDETSVIPGTDGDETHMEVRIEGAFTSDGTATGTLEANERYINGQDPGSVAGCESGTVEWQADEADG